GLISGDITCSTSQDAPGCQLNNHQEGIATGAQQYKANVHNDGQLIVNRPGELQPLTIMGEFTQSSTGSLSGINVDFDQKRSSLVSIQNQASLDGSVEVTPVALLPDVEVAILNAQTLQGELTAIDSP